MRLWRHDDACFFCDATCFQTKRDADGQQVVTVVTNSLQEQIRELLRSLVKKHCVISLLDERLRSVFA